MEAPSIRKVSPADIEAAIARALAEVTGWDTCAVSVEKLEFPVAASSETVAIALRVRFGPNTSDLPF